MSTKVTDLPAVTQQFISTDALLVSKHVTQTSGTLIVGEEYTILDFNAGDNFSNVANVTSGTINTTGCVFIATGNTPTTYSNGSTLAYYQSQKFGISDLGLSTGMYKSRLSYGGGGGGSFSESLLIDTTNGVTFSKVSTGYYKMTTTDFIPFDKMFIVNPYQKFDITGGYVIAFVSDDSEVTIYAYDSSDTLADSIMSHYHFGLEIYK